MMVTSIGASIDVHFCNGQIYSIGINASADLCEGFFTQNDLEGIASIEKSICCAQFLAHFQSDVDSTNDKVAIHYSIDTEAIPFQQEISIPNASHSIQLSHCYNPPEYEKDILTLFSVLRI